MKKIWRAEFSTYDGERKILAGEVFESENDWSKVFKCLGIVREEMAPPGEVEKRKLDEIYKAGLKEMAKEVEEEVIEITENEIKEVEEFAEEIKGEENTKKEVEEKAEKIQKMRKKRR